MSATPDGPGPDGSKRTSRTPARADTASFRIVTGDEVWAEGEPAARQEAWPTLTAVAIGFVCVGAFFVLDAQYQSEHERVTLQGATTAAALAHGYLERLGPIVARDDALYAGDTALRGGVVVDEVERISGYGCTIFLDDVRVATTATAAGGEGRAIGTRANEEVVEHVLRGESTFVGQTETIGKRWVVRYEPLRDGEGEVVGMLAAYQDHALWLSGLIQFRVVLGGALSLLFLVLVWLVLRLHRQAQARVGQEREQARVRTHFFAAMSHELRSPLVVVLNTAQALQAASEEGETRASAAEIESEARDLLAVIGNILDVSKLEAGEMDLLFEDLEIRPLLERAGDRARRLLKSDAVEVVVQVEPGCPGVRADAIKLLQVLQNLLANAIKFTEEGTITLSARHAGPGSDMVEIEVDDTGIGMNAEQLAQIWRPFRQADESTARRFGGTGLGLTIVQKLVEAMDGRVSARSKEGRGSTFLVCVPMVEDDGLRSEA